MKSMFTPQYLIHKIRLAVTAVSVAFLCGLMPAFVSPLVPAAAAAPQSTSCGVSKDATFDTSCLPKTPANNNTLNTIVSIVFGVAGSIALLMIVIGGLRYILAHGDPSAVNTAKNTILYSIIGLLVTMMAYGIVALVVGKIA